MPLKICYVQRLFPWTGREDSLMGRSLLAHLHREFDVQLVDGVFEEPPKKDAPEHMLVDEFNRANFDVVYLEEGLFWPHADWKIPEPVVRQFVSAGGIVIAADVGRNQFGAMGEGCRYSRLQEFFGCSPQRDSDGPGFIRYVQDYVHNLESVPYTPVVRLDRMRISDWLHTAYSGIDRLALAGPVVLNLTGGASILLSGNIDTTKTLSGDYERDQGFPEPIGTVNEVGLGFAVLIAAGISLDLLVDAVPDNARWISNLCTFLADEVGRAKERRGLTKGSPTTSSAVLELMQLDESQTLEFKSTARWNIHSGRADKAMEHAVVKTVCGFLNAKGGVLLIGVDDNKNVLGLASDMATLSKKPNRDGFELWLRQKLSDCLSVPTAAVVEIRFEKIDERDLCVVQVETSKKPVFATSEDRKGKGEFWVREGNRTVELHGEEMFTYRDHHWN